MHERTKTRKKAINKGSLYKIKDEIDLFECKALGFDPTVEIALSDNFS
ncbi:hypothetical protein D1AOALGA4SA_11588 [Olavius algarvensis Delta 1 endosymbiont]|nr:hypothetical protein D1AOALGA4SA_11588 [Olavius algarvensis Delta 1 endosymbiont]